jgi:precorrin-2/cobalt-factor-2 C20-methyltransferase
MKGTFHGLGLGPGDPELITLKAWRLISSVEVIAWPVGPSGRARAREIVSPLLPEDVVTLPLPIPFGDKGPALDAAYDAAARRIADHLDEGRDVAWLCLGDPLFHGTYVPLAARLAENYSVQAVPGIIAPAAAAAVLGRPLAMGEIPLKVLPATAGPERLRAEISAGPATFAFIKTARRGALIRDLIAQAGLMDNAWALADIGTAAQRVLPLADLGEEELPYFSTILVLADNRKAGN